MCVCVCVCVCVCRCACLLFILDWCQSTSEHLFSLPISSVSWAHFLLSSSSLFLSLLSFCPISHPNRHQLLSQTSYKDAHHQGLLHLRPVRHMKCTLAHTQAIYGLWQRWRGVTQEELLVRFSAKHWRRTCCWSIHLLGSDWNISTITEWISITFFLHTFSVPGGWIP